MTSTDEVGAAKAVDWIKNLTREVMVGEVFTGKVSRLFDFGAMVEILPGQEGMVHVSELANYRVNKVSDVVKIGDVVQVKVINIDEKGRVNLSIRALLPNNGGDNPGYKEEKKPFFKRGDKGKRF